jgi:hypothetical protein
VRRKARAGTPFRRATIYFFFAGAFFAAGLAAAAFFTGAAFLAGAAFFTGAFAAFATGVFFTAGFFTAGFFATGILVSLSHATLIKERAQTLSESRVRRNTQYTRNRAEFWGVA